MVEGGAREGEGSVLCPVLLGQIRTPTMGSGGGRRRLSRKSRFGELIWDPGKELGTGSLSLQEKNTPLATQGRKLWEHPKVTILLEPWQGHCCLHDRQGDLLQTAWGQRAQYGEMGVAGDRQTWSTVR